MPRIADRLVKARRIRRSPAASYSAAQNRVISAALDLFAEHGVNGTSLQMIADAIGVTKAAVYHQFKTKEEIVVAAADVELLRVEAAVDAAESETSPARARDVLLERVIDLAIERRRKVSTLLNDPVVVRIFARRKPFQQLMGRLSSLLIGDGGGTAARLPAAMLLAAISGAVMHPLVVDLDDDTLRSQLLHLARRFLDLPE